MAVTIVLILAKTLYFFSRFFKIGAGLTWPGHLVLFFSPNFVEKQVGKLKRGVILIAGTNGKTTTSQALASVLEESALSVVTNVSGANLLNGMASALVTKLAWSGNLAAEIGVFEVDEASLPIVLGKITPQYVLLLNLFRDQLDRYGEVETIVTKWAAALRRLPLTTALVVNANDPAISFLGELWGGPVIYFGLDDRSQGLDRLPHHADSLHCAKCNHSLTYSSVYFSHLGVWSCPNCQRKMPLLTFAASHVAVDKEGLSFLVDGAEIKTGLTGLYNVYNFLSVYALGRHLGLEKALLIRGLGNFRAHFGRQESFRVSIPRSRPPAGGLGRQIRILRSRILGRQIRDLTPIHDVLAKILLSKNPTGFNENLRLLKKIVTADDALVFLLNDGIADGTDVSWIYDVEFEEYLPLLQRGVYLSGTRFLDMAVRLKYAGLTGEKMVVKRKMNEVLNRALENTSPLSTVYILPTYTAMLAARKLLTGRSF